MTRDEVLDEFGSAACENECEAGDCISERKMADEIVRLRSILADIRKLHPTSQVFAMWCNTCDEELPCRTLKALNGDMFAVTAAEQEVAGER